MDKTGNKYVISIPRRRGIKTKSVEARIPVLLTSTINILKYSSTLT